MKFSNLKVGKRLGIGFGVLLFASLIIGGVSWLRLSQIDAAMNVLVKQDWVKARITMEMEERTRDNAAKTLRILLAGNDSDAIEKLEAEIAANSKANNAGIEQLTALVRRPEGRQYLAEAAEAREKYNASRARVMELAKDPRTRDEAIQLYKNETSGLLEQYVQPFRKLKELQEVLFAESSGQVEAAYRNARYTIIFAGAAALIFGIALAIVLARSIVRPLSSAVQIADAVKQGRLDNVVEVEGDDETAQLLSSLDEMQRALRERDEKDAEYRGRIAAIGRAQAVIEFDMQGMVRDVNENFARVMGYTREEVVGKHHSMFAEAAFAGSADYRDFWGKLNRGESDVGIYKRLAKGGREVWITASYNPIPDASGKPVKVVKYASDVTEQTRRNAEYQGQLEAIGRSQAVIEFDMDGTVRMVNDNFARVMGYTASEVVGKHHSMFVEPAVAAGADYRNFWARLNRGESDIGSYKHVAKGGREVWLQSSYNPIPDTNGRPFKVVKYASDVSGAIQAQQALQVAVRETLDTVKHAIDGELTHRVPMEGKTGDLEALCRGVNSLLESTSDLVRRVKIAASEVHMGAEEIAKGNSNLSQRTEEQASSLEETASSMEEMTSTVRHTADNAGQANQLAMAARQQAEKGGAVVSSTVNAMGEINAASKKIADIIGVIDEIAFQTNLLALNAAVEAARAGEQGRGFAVVATEVRNLAGRSATAAKEIKTLIQDSVAKVNEGTKLVDESGKTLEEIMMAVKKVTDIVAEIAAASREQSSGIEQVNKAVLQMDETTQQNAALVEEAAASSQAIVEQAQTLSTLIARYDVGVVEIRAKPKSAVRTERRAKERPWPMPRTAVGGDSEWSEF